MHAHSVSDYAHAFAWLMLIPFWTLCFGVGWWIASVRHGKKFCSASYLKRTETLTQRVSA